MTSPTDPDRSRRARRIVIANVIVGLAIMAIVSFAIRSRLSQPSAPPRQVVVAQADTQKLDVKSRSVELVSDKAFRARNAIKHGDYTVARKVIATVLAHSEIQDWRFYPFSDLIEAISDVNDPSFGKRLDAWVSQSRKDPIPLLVRARYDLDEGWSIRGNNFATKTPATAMSSFEKYLIKALADVDAEIALSPQNPYGYYLRLRILRGYGYSLRLMNSFTEAIKKFPNYYPLYTTVLDILQPKWGGSLGAMYAFVDRYAGNAGKHSPLKMLYVDLYGDILDIASNACAGRTKDQMSQCVGSVMEKLTRPGLERQITGALQLYDVTDKHQFDAEIWPLLGDMLGASGADRYAGEMLQLAASATHSDTQMVEDDPGHNDYVIDRLVALSWYDKNFHGNAMTKYKEALKDARKAKFPDEAQKDVAIGDILGDIGRLHVVDAEYRQTIAYEKAAIAIGGDAGSETLVCFSNFKLKRYKETLATCTKAIDRTDDPEAHYWRGFTYQHLGQTDAAIKDFTAIAGSQSSYRPSSANEVSIIYDKQKQFRQALAVLDRYPYLFDPKIQTKKWLAISYNNRCYDYMELGQLKKALADCTESLKYGSLPDAYRKEQELAKRLRDRGH